MKKIFLMLLACMLYIQSIQPSSGSNSSQHSSMQKVALFGLCVGAGVTFALQFCKKRIYSEDLLTAAKYKDISFAHSAIQKRADITYVGDTERHKGRTALMHAAANGDGVIAMIIANEADRVSLQNGSTVSNLLDVKNSRGYTALHMASHHGHYQVVQALLEAKADSQIKGGKGESTLQLAAQKKHPDIVRLLMTDSLDFEKDKRTLEPYIHKDKELYDENMERAVDTAKQFREWRQSRTELR